METTGGQSDVPAPPRKGTHRASRVIALMNQKGGVGKTTTSVNLAAGLAAVGRPTLLVDLDPQGHATMHMGVDPGSVDPSLYDLLLDPPAASGEGLDPLDALMCIRPNLGLLPCNVDMAAAEHELSDVDERQLRLRRILAPLLEIYEFVLIDCPPSLGLLTLNGLAAAREVMVPMQAHFLALQGVGKLLETVTLVGQHVNPSLRVSGIILCMHDENTRHSREVVDDIRSFLEDSSEQDVPWAGARVCDPAIRRNIKLAECPSFGQTVFEYAPGCPGAQDYGALAQSLVDEWDAMQRRMDALQVDRPVEVEVPEPEVVVPRQRQDAEADTAAPDAAAAREQN